MFLDKTVKMSAEESNNNEDPKTALIVLGEAMYFQPSADVVSVTILAKSALKTALTSVAPACLENLHVVVKGVDVSNMYDADALPVLVEALQPNGTVTAHLLVSAEGVKASDEDVDTLRTSFVMAGLRLGGEEENPDGSKILVGQKQSTSSGGI